MDRRLWIPTDLPGEMVSASVPRERILIMSARGSTRRWTEVNDYVSVAAVAPNQPRVAAFWKTRGRSLVTTAGGLMATEPGDIHVTTNVTAPADFDLVRLGPTLVAEAAEGLEHVGRFHLRTPSLEDAVVHSAIRRFVAVNATGQTPFEVDAACGDLLAAIVQRLSEVPQKTGVKLDPVRDYRLRRAREYLMAHIEDRPKLDTLAGDLGLSKFRLCALFKDAFGVSIGQFWTACRIHEAERRLLLGVPIKDVARDLGFSDVLHPHLQTAERVSPSSLG